MVAWELLTGFTTAASTTLTGLTMATGNSLTLRNFESGKKAYLVQAWVDSQTSGDLRLRGPEFSNNVQGIRLGHVASEVYPLLPDLAYETLRRNQIITAELSGSGTAGDIDTACMLIHYEDLEGINGKFITVEEAKGRIKHIATVQNTLSLTTAGGYSGEEAINAEQDVLSSDTEYALLGYVTNTECAAIRWRGAETGNLGVGGPGNETNKNVTRDWFVKLGELTGFPSIPVFTWDNKSNILIDGCQDENGADPTVTSIFAELE